MMDKRPYNCEVKHYHITKINRECYLVREYIEYLNFKLKLSTHPCNNWNLTRKYKLILKLIIKVFKLIITLKIRDSELYHNNTISILDKVN